MLSAFANLIANEVSRPRSRQAHGRQVGGLPDAQAPGHQTSLDKISGNFFRDIRELCDAENVPTRSGTFQDMCGSRGFNHEVRK